MAMSWTSLTGTKTTAGSIKSWVNYDRIDPGEVLFEAERLIYGLLRVREMRTSTTLSVTLNDLNEALPARFLDPWACRIPTQWRDLVQVHEETLVQQRSWDTAAGNYSTGIPTCFAIFGEALQFDCRASEALSVFLGYYESKAPLAADNLTNFLTDRYPQILRAACCAMAADFMDDDGAYARYTQRLGVLVETAMRENELSRRGSDLRG
jgi:hypothetical protein